MRTAREKATPYDNTKRNVAIGTSTRRHQMQAIRKELYMVHHQCCNERQKHDRYHVGDER